VATKYQVNITATAEQDIADIWAYIAGDNPSAANAFIHALDEQIISLASFPERNPLIPEATLLHTQLYRHLLYRSYRIIYRIEQETVIIFDIFR
jgi:plasmid stabilization system protein ParE